MHRWTVIQLAVGMFQGYFSQIEARNQSGVTEQDKICQALEMYKSIHNSTFSFIHCWKELQNSPKFFSNSSNSAPSTPDSVSLDDIDADRDECVFQRPIGRKAAKEKKNKR